MLQNLLRALTNESNIQVRQRRTIPEQAVRTRERSDDQDQWPVGHEDDSTEAGEKTKAADAEQGGLEQSAVHGSAEDDRRKGEDRRAKRPPTPRREKASSLHSDVRIDPGGGEHAELDCGPATCLPARCP